MTDSHTIPAEVTVKDLLKYSPYYFTREVFGYRVDGCHERILEHVAGPQRSLTLCARGHGKSLMVSGYVTWLMVNHPNVRILLISQSDRKAQMFLSKIKTVLQSSDLIKEYYGELEGDKWSDHALTIKTRTSIYAEPNLMAMGANSSQAVGVHVDLIVLDDVVDFDLARSEVKRERLLDWYRTTLLPTLLSSGRIVVVGTRYAVGDLYNNMIHMGFNELKLPAIQEDGTALCPWIRPLNDIVDPLTGEVVHEGLDSIKRNLGSVIFALQYQNDVTLLEEGTLIKYDDLRFYKKTFFEDNQIYVIVDGKKIKIDRVCIGVDPAISQTDYANYTAMITTGRDKDRNIYVLDIVNKHLSFHQQVLEVERLVKKYQPQETAIEKVAYQEALIQELQRRGGLKIRAISPTRDKVARLMSVAGLFESNSVYLKEVGMDKYISQLVLFPESEDKDMVDATVFSLMGQKRSQGGVMKLEF